MKRVYTLGFLLTVALYIYKASNEIESNSLKKAKYLISLHNTNYFLALIATSYDECKVSSIKGLILYTTEDMP